MFYKSSNYCTVDISLTTEDLGALGLPLPTATSTTSLPNNVITSSSGSHYATTLHQSFSPSDSTVEVVSAPNVSGPQPKQSL